MSFEGRVFSCNPKYIYLELKENPNLKHFIVKDKKASFDGLVTAVKYKSFYYYYLMLTCKIIITNNISIAYIPFRKNQYIIGTWHAGGAYKKVGADINTSLKQKNLFRALSNNVDLMVSSCEVFSKIMEKAYFIDEDKFISSGMPRNDILINRGSDDLYVKIREKYNIPTENKIVLYAPTFRGNLNDPVKNLKDIYDIDIPLLKKALKKRFSGEFTVLFRAHYYLFDLNIFDNSVIDVSNYPDMQELLYVSDVLITDYSSSIWDFSLTQKPIFIYASDLLTYVNERDFYTKIEKWPFSIAKNNEELFNNILSFDENIYKEKVLNHHKDLGSFEDGKASIRVKEKILDFLDKI